MDNLWLAAILGFILAVLYSRTIVNRAFDRLERDERLRLVEARGIRQTAAPILVMLGAILFYVLTRQRWPESPWPGLVFVAGLCALYTAGAWRQLRIVRQLGIGDDFYRAVRNGRIAGALGLLVLVVLFMLRMTR